MDLEIQTRQVEMRPGWRRLIEERLAGIAARYPRLIRVHVTLEKGRHHLQGLARVDVVASHPGATFRVSKEKEAMCDALHAALDAFEREVAAHHDTRRHFEKAPGFRPAGTIARVFTDRDYGFIRTDEGEEVYFHRHALHDLDFAALEIGMPVDLEIERGARGLQASRVFPPGERRAG